MYKNQKYFQFSYETIRSQTSMTFNVALAIVLCDKKYVHFVIVGQDKANLWYPNQRQFS